MPTIHTNRHPRADYEQFLPFVLHHGLALPDVLRRLVGRGLGEIEATDEELTEARAFVALHAPGEEPFLFR